MRKHFTVYVALFLSILLFGCSSRNAPAPVSSLDNQINPTTRKVNITGSSYRVQKGDTLYSIAFSAQKDFRSLAKINRIPAPYTIYPGQRILLKKAAVKPKKTKKYTKWSKKSTVSKQKNNKKIKKNQSILIYSNENEIVREIKPNQSTYILKNTYIKKNSNIKFGIKSNGGILKTSPILSYSKGTLYESFKKKHIIDDTKLENSIPYNLSSDFEVLDEIKIKTNKRKLKNKPYGAMTMLRGVRIDDIMISSGETIIEFLRFKGISINLDFEEPETKDKSESGNDFDAKSGFTSLGKAKITEVYLNDINVTKTPWLLEGIYLNSIEEIFYGRDPGTQADKTVDIYSLSPTEYSSKKAQFSNLKIPYGFSLKKEYITYKSLFKSNNPQDYLFMQDCMSEILQYSTKRFAFLKKKNQLGTYNKKKCDTYRQSKNFTLNKKKKNILSARYARAIDISIQAKCALLVELKKLKLILIPIRM